MVLGERIQVLWLLFEQPHLGQTAAEQRFKGRGFPQILPFCRHPMMGTKHPAPGGQPWHCWCPGAPCWERFRGEMQHAACRH